MNIKEIREIVDLLTEKGIAEFELERSGFRIRISRRAAQAANEAVYIQAPAMMSVPTAAVTSSPAAASSAASGGGARSTLPTPPPSMGSSASGAALSDEIHTVKS